jgi:uncharacterized protein (TIGR00730 family)
MRRVCVFCGSSPGARPVFAEAARSLGRLMAERGLTLVYGGGNVGLMGILADTVLERGGEVIGVIPASLVAWEVAHRGLTELRVVDSMHARKAQMADLADGFVALPGGLGTLEEFLEVCTWAQLGFHAKPMGLLDVEGYFAPLLHLLDHAVAERFLRPEHRALVMVGTDAGALLDVMAARPAAPPRPQKWIDRDER